MIITIVVTAVVTATADYAIFKYAPGLLAKLEASNAVSDILSEFHKLHDKLLAAAEHHQTVSDAKLVEAGQLQVAAGQSAAQASEALNAADKIASIIGAPTPAAVPTPAATAA